MPVGSLARRLAALALATVLGLPVAGPRPASAETRDPVEGLSGLFAMVASPARVFVSDPSGGHVAVLRYRGELARTLSDLPGAAGMAVVGQTLYVAESGGTAIARFDISGLRPRSAGSIDTRPYAPRDLAYAGGRLWFTAGPCEASGGLLVSVAPDGTGLAEYVSPAPVGWTACPRLDASPYAPNLLFVQGTSSAPVTLFEYDVAAGTPSLVTSKDLGWAGTGGSDVAVLPGGAELATGSQTASEAPGLSQFAVADLSGPATAYTADAFAGTAIAATEAAGGMVAGGISAPVTDQVWVWRVGQPEAVRSFDLGAGVPVLARGLVFSPDGTRLFAATQPSPGEVEVRSLDPREPATVTLEASAQTVAFGSSADLTATLAGGATNRTVQVYGTASGGTRKLVAEGEVDADGVLAVSVEPRASTTYSAVYEGDASTTAARSEPLLVQVRPRVTGRMVEADGRVGRYAVYDFSQTCPDQPTTCPLFRISARPDLTEGDFHYVLESRVGSAWRTELEGQEQLGPRSRIVMFFSIPDPSSVGTPFRARVEFAASDAYAPATSRWAYFKLR